MRKLSMLLFIIFSLVLVIGSIVSAEEEVYDFEGETITFTTMHHLNMGAIFEEGKEAEHLENIEEKYNVNIEFSSAESDIVEESISAIMGGEMTRSILHVSQNDFERLIFEGVLYSLNEVLDDEYFNKLQPTHRKQLKEYGEIAGDYYGFCSNDLSDFSFDVTNVAFIMWNKDLLEQEGVTTPYELYEQDKWTWDNFRDILSEVTRDTDGDGEVDQWGLSTLWGINHPFIINSFVQSNDGSMTRYKDNKVTYALDEEKSIEAINLLKDLSTSGYVGPEHWDGLDAFVNGDIAFFIGNKGNWSTGIANEMEAHYAPMFIPKGPKAEDYSISGSTTRFVLPVSIEEDPEALISLVNSLFKITTNYRTEEEYMEEIIASVAENAQDRKAIQIFNKMHKKWEPTKYETFFREEGIFDAFNQAFQDEQSVSAVIEGHKEAIQTSIDEVLDQ